jgi:TRAP-type C4-dicarboxylate transport system permease small subunit
VKAFRPLLLALRAALLATAVFWVALQVVDRLGWQAPLGATEPAIFFVVFFFGLLMSGKG